MTADLKAAPQMSGTIFGFSGTQFTDQGTVNYSLLCGISGLAIIPIRVDGTGAIENTT